jgi:hypothetical protein
LPCTSLRTAILRVFDRTGLLTDTEIVPGFGNGNVVFLKDCIELVPEALFGKLFPVLNTLLKKNLAVLSALSDKKVDTPFEPFKCPHGAEIFHHTCLFVVGEGFNVIEPDIAIVEFTKQRLESFDFLDIFI